MGLKELPGEIMELIFSKLPFFNLPTCRLVCKSWNELVLTCKKLDDPKPSISSNLLIAQTSSSPNNNLCCLELDVDDDKNQQGICTVSSFTSLFEIINSCNGLLCGSIGLRESVCVLNPMTNEYLQLPSQPSNHLNYGSYEYGYGFGFNPNTKQYKIVRHSFASHETGELLVEIFALGTTSRQWTRVTLVPFDLFGHGTYFNGALYWIGSHPRSRPRPRALVIFRFDLEDEKFEETSFTGSSPGGGDFYGVLGVFQDALYLTTLRGQVWKLEQDCSSSWIKVFAAPLLENMPYDRAYYILIKVYEDGRILFAYGSDIILYHPTNGTSQILKRGINKHFFVYQFDSLTFDSLHKILALDA